MTTPNRPKIKYLSDCFTQEDFVGMRRHDILPNPWTLQ